jgi:hypothetical protein
MDLMIGSLNFHIDSLGSIRLSDPMKLNPSAGKTAIAVTSESLVGSSSEVNSPVSFTMTGKEDTIKELDEIMRNLDLGKVSDHSDSSQNFSRNKAADFTTRNGGVSNQVHQVCIIISEATKDDDGTDNMVFNTQGGNPKNNQRKEKERVYVSAREWRIIMSAINHGTRIPADLGREVLMGYQYALHQHKNKLLKEKLRRSQENNSTSSRPHWAEYSEMSDLAKKGIVSQNTIGKGQNGLGTRTAQGASTHCYKMKRRTSYKKRQKQPWWQHKHIYLPHSQNPEIRGSTCTKRP